MAQRKKMANGFMPMEAAPLCGLSVHMLNYLAREGYLKPTYGGSGRGRVRYYSYRDLVVGRIVARLLASGLEISRLKASIARLSRQTELSRGDAASQLRMLGTDGARLFFVDPSGSVRDLTQDGQLAFAFVLDVQSIRNDLIDELEGDRLRLFNLANRKLRLAA